MWQCPKCGQQQSNPKFHGEHVKTCKETPKSDAQGK